MGMKGVLSWEGTVTSPTPREFCIDPRTPPEWEQGRKKPEATTGAYLAVMAKNREAALKAAAS